MTAQPAFQLPAGFSLPPPPVNGGSIASNTPAPPRIDTNAIVAKYRDLREKKSLLEAKHKSELAPVRDEMEKIEAILMEELTQTGANSVNTPSGTAYKSTKHSYKIEDPGTFRAWAEANGHLDFYENRPSKESLDAWVEAGNPLPPGVTASSFTSVNIRK